MNQSNYFLVIKPFDSSYRYFWKVTSKPNISSNQPIFEIDTNQLDIGDKQRIQIQISQTGKAAITGSAYINIKEKSAEQTESEAVAANVAWSNDETLKQSILIKPSQAVEKGNDISLSLKDGSKFKQAGCKYSWLVYEHTELGRSYKDHYVIKTDSLNTGDKYRVGVSITLPDGARKNASLYFSVTTQEDTPEDDSIEKLTSTCALDELVNYAKSTSRNEFTVWARGIFGNDISSTAYSTLYNNLIANSVKPIDIVTGDKVNTAYDKKLHKINITSVHLLLALDGHFLAVWMLFHIIFEEYGHHIDYLLRNEYSTVGGDALKDEGANFAFLLADIVFEKQTTFLFAHYNGSKGEKNLWVGEIHKSVNDAIDRQPYINNDKKDTRYEYNDAGNWPVCTTGDQVDCGTFGGLVNTRVFPSNPYNGWAQSIAQGNERNYNSPRERTELNKAIAIKYKKGMEEFTDALKVLGTGLEAAAYALEPYLKETLLRLYLSDPIILAIKIDLREHPEYDFVSLDYSFSFARILDKIAYLPALQKLPKVALLAKIIAKFLGTLSVTYEVNVDRYDRIYIGAGLEWSIKLKAAGKGHPVSKEVAILKDLSTSYTRSKILNPKPKLPPKDYVHGFLTGWEFNGAINLFNLVVAGGTYAAGPEQYSFDYGATHDFSELKFLADISLGLNYSICLNDNRLRKNKKRSLPNAKKYKE